MGLQWFASACNAIQIKTNAIQCNPEDMRCIKMCCSSLDCLASYVKHALRAVRRAQLSISVTVIGMNGDAVKCIEQYGTSLAVFDRTAIQVDPMPSDEFQTCIRARRIFNA